MKIVTPHVGVWIETELHINNNYVEYVTPHVGVWIETYNMKHINKIRVSHLM